VCARASSPWAARWCASQTAARRSASVPAPRPGIAVRRWIVSPAVGTACSMPIGSLTAMTDVALAGPAEHTAMLDRGEITSQELTEIFLERIERHDPALNAFRVVFAERARAEAAQADA